MKRAKDGTQQAYALLSLQETGSRATAHGCVLISPQRRELPSGLGRGSAEARTTARLFASALPGRGSAVRKLEGILSVFVFFSNNKWAESVINTLFLLNVSAEHLFVDKVSVQ